MIFSPLRKAVIAAAGVVAVGAAGGVAVHAAVSSSPTGASLTASTPSTSPSPNSSTCVPGIALGAAKQVLAIAAKDTGLTEQQILDQLRQGKTFDQIAGSKAATVEQDVLSALKARLDKAVSSGRLTQDRENTMLAKAKTALDTAMSSDLSKRIPANGTPTACGHKGKGGVNLLRTLITVTAQKTGLTEQQVMQDLRNGESIDQIAGSKAADIKATVLQQLQQELSSQLDQAMSHSGGVGAKGGGGFFGFGFRGGHGMRGGVTPANPGTTPTDLSGV